MNQDKLVVSNCFRSIIDKYGWKSVDESDNKGKKTIVEQSKHIMNECDWNQNDWLDAIDEEWNMLKRS